LFSNIPAFAQTTYGEASVAEATALLRMPEIMIEGLQPLTAKVLETSPRLIDARLKALAAAAREEETRSLTRPRADVYVSAGYRATDASPSGSFQNYYNVSAEQPIWHWNSLDKQKRVAQIQRQLADNDYDEARRLLVLDIRQRYLALALQKLDAAETDAACERLSSHLKASRDQAARGQISTDLLTAEELDVKTAEFARDRKREAFQRALRAFAVLNGMPSFSPDGLPSQISEVSSALVGLLSPAVPPPSAQGVPPAALARVQGELTTAQLNNDITRVRNLPMVNLAVGANQDQTSGADQTAVLSYYGGVNVRWNIFDGFATRAAVRQAKVVVRQSERALADTRTQLAQDLADGAADVALAVKELQIAEERFVQTSARQQVDEDLRKSGRLADAEWQARRGAAQVERANLFKLRGGLILLLAEQELLRQRATKPSKEIAFP
jgi:outer membrane protein TolC